jgi:RHS repeat-associated core domain
MYNCLSAMTFNGTAYTYEKDAQGDIIGLFDSSDNEVVKYSYDSWGKLIGIGGSLADTLGKGNPFRYRSYYYDSESQLYYLQSRYYNPEIGRFISEDDSGHHDDNDPISSNLYAYCNNDPVNFIDPSGNTAVEITKDLAYFLICNTLTVSATQNGQFSDLFYFFGFYRDTKGVYHARQDCLQQYGGYNNFYDTVFATFTNMLKAIFKFNYKGKDFQFWTWKGNYLNLGAGAELGIYSRLYSTEHWLAIGLLDG